LDEEGYPQTAFLIDENTAITSTHGYMDYKSKGCKKRPVEFQYYEIKNG